MVGLSDFLFSESCPAYRASSYFGKSYLDPGCNTIDCRRNKGRTRPKDRGGIEPPFAPALSDTPLSGQGSLNHPSGYTTGSADIDASGGQSADALDVLNAAIGEGYRHD